MTARRFVCAHCSHPATCEAMWWAEPCDQHDGRNMGPRFLCDDCANDLRRNAEPRNYRTGIHAVKVRAL